MLACEGTEVSDRRQSNLKQAALSVLLSRVNNRKVFGGDISGDPALEIMLNLYLANDTEMELSIPKICEKCSLSPNLARRWIALLKDKGYVSGKERGAHLPETEIMLSSVGSSAVERYLLGLMLAINAASSKPL